MKTNFRVLADDIMPRWIVAMTILNSSSVGGGDRFGNIMILKAPPEVKVASSAAFPLGATSATAECELTVKACLQDGSIITELSLGDLRPLVSKYGDSSIENNGM